MKLVVGCPVRQREWILDLWHERVTKTIDNVSFVFVVGSDDKPTIDIVSQWTDDLVMVEEPSVQRRSWDEDRVSHMVFLRNLLLRRVREIEPDLFLSLDSDILLSDQAFNGMLETIHKYSDLNCWAVGGKTYMTAAGVECPSYGMWHNRNHSSIVRPPAETVFPVDVILAIKLMTPLAYGVDYTYHPWGEDLGWADNLRLSGGKLWWDGRYPSKHIIGPSMLDKQDKRFDW